MVWNEKRIRDVNIIQPEGNKHIWTRDCKSRWTARLHFFLFSRTEAKLPLRQALQSGSSAFIFSQNLVIVLLSCSIKVQLVHELDQMRASLSISFSHAHFTALQFPHLHLMHKSLNPTAARWFWDLKYLECHCFSESQGSVSLTCVEQHDPPLRSQPGTLWSMCPVELRPLMSHIISSDIITHCWTWGRISSLFVYFRNKIVLLLIVRVLCAGVWKFPVSVSDRY